ncbi:tetratricopeptide repeat protein [Microcoleus sp. Z1_B5]|uniref:tetratricopeptide repeat protein n=1 Tax=Microcoleus sp. Z1_B5 TaxID=3055430 RepID=UPI002FD684DE
MGIGITTFNFYCLLRAQGYFTALKSVIEIGDQSIMVANWDDFAARIAREVGDFSHNHGEAITAKSLYESLGFENYKCIDTCESLDSLVFDMNKDLAETYGYSKQFDLVTNHGSSEHCFNQYQCFKNIHNLCREGGVMIHGLPFHGSLNHGFYNYQPSFFQWLVGANDYKLLSLAVVDVKSAKPVTPYSQSLVESLPSSIKEPRLIFVAIQKLTESEFRIPYDGQYLSNRLSPAPIVKEYQNYQKLSNDYIRYGNENVNSGKIEEAIFEYQEAIITNSYSWEGYLMMGIAQAKIGNLEEAIYSYQKVISINPNSSEAHYRLGVALQEQGNLDGGIKSYKRAIALLQPEWQK